MPSLTHAEAVQRAALVQPTHYSISLDLTPDGPQFLSRTTIAFAATRPGSATFVDVKAAAVQSAILNGRELDPAAVSDGRLPLTDLAADNELVLTATMSYSSDGEGLHRHVDPADGRTYLYAMSFLDAGPRWFASFDQPDLKATYDLEVRCDPDWIVLGNGAATRTAPGEWTLATTRPLSTYFVTLVAGPYSSVISEHDGITLGLHARASLAAELEAGAPEMLEVTRRSFDRYHELFGSRYPFGEYHQAFCPDFNAGAMENPGCVTLRDQYVFRSATTKAERGTRANTIVHEMAHMWFGDLVTMRWWDDLWLNESFAEYMAHRVCSEVTDFAAWTAFGIRRKDWGYVADQAPSTHPVAGNGSPDAAAALADFDGISYAKGASALKQLAAYLGDEIFFGGLRRYFTQHAYGNAEFADLIAAWTAAGAVGIEEWSAQWLRTAGLDTLTAAASGTAVTVTRISPDTSDRPHTIRVAGFDQDGRLILDEPVTIGAAEITLSAPAPVLLAVADSRDDSWAKLRFGVDGWQAVDRLLPAVQDGLTRVVIYNALRDAVRSADLDPAVALDLIVSNLPAESEQTIVGDLLRFADEQLSARYSPVAQRPARQARVAELSQLLLAGAPAGSDLQLIAARSLLRTTTDVALLRGWLNGPSSVAGGSRPAPDGLAVDAEIRWSLIERLAVLGAADAELIGAELANDLSTAGSGHAARARAMLADPAAKQAAWKMLTEPSDTPAHELYATAEGFFQPNQTELTAPYVARFFTELPRTAEHRQGWALSQTVLLAYPASAADRSTLELAERALDEPALDSGVRRSLVDATDALRRAVASLNLFGAG
ncbi:aminopeptidase N [soil metagenome]